MSLNIYAARLFKAGLKLVIYSQEDYGLGVDDIEECNVNFLSIVKDKFKGINGLSNRNYYTYEFNLLLKYRLGE